VVNIVSKNKLGNQEIILLDKKSDYITSILSQNKKFDIIIIDGKYRYECSKNAVKCMSEGGLIILDNSDWFPKTARPLRKQNLIEIYFLVNREYHLVSKTVNTLFFANYHYNG